MKQNNFLQHFEKGSLYFMCKPVGLNEALLYIYIYIYIYTLFPVLTGTTFNLNKTQLGTVLAQVMISVLKSIESIHKLINKNYFPRDFKISLRVTGTPTPDSYCLHSCFLQLRE